MCPKCPRFKCITCVTIDVLPHTFSLVDCACYLFCVVLRQKWPQSHLKKNFFYPVFQVISDAAGQGVTISGTKTFNNWNWPNAVIFAATVITTIGRFLIHL